MDTSADDLNESVESTGRGRKRRVDEFVSPGDPITVCLFVMYIGSSSNFWNLDCLLVIE